MHGWANWMLGLCFLTRIWLMLYLVVVVVVVVELPQAPEDDPQKR